MVEAGGYGKRELVVRVNALATSWGYDDLATVAAASADAILLPKVGSGNIVHQAEPEEEIGWSRKVISAHEKAMADGQGVAAVEGRLIEYLHVENARRLVAMAEMIEELESASAD